MIRVMQFVGLGTAAPAGAMLISPHEPLPAFIPVTAVHGVQEVPAPPVPPVVPSECHRQRHRPDYSPRRSASTMRRRTPHRLLTQ